MNINQQMVLEDESVFQTIISEISPAGFELDQTSLTSFELDQTDFALDQTDFELDQTDLLAGRLVCETRISKTILRISIAISHTVADITCDISDSYPSET